MSIPIDRLIDYFPLFGLILSFIGFAIVVNDAIIKIRHYKQQKFPFLDHEFSRHKLVLPRHANHWIFQLISYATDINPDCIVGLNRGGTMLGAYLALGLNIPSKRFVPCLVDPNTSNRDDCEVKCDIANLSGKVLIVDDICRRGSTMSAALKFFESKRDSSKIDKIHSAVLVCSLNNKSRPVCNVSYSAYQTKHRDLKLPWTPENYGFTDKSTLFRDIEHESITNLAKEISHKLYDSVPES